MLGSFIAIFLGYQSDTVPTKVTKLQLTVNQYKECCIVPLYIPIFWKKYQENAEFVQKKSAK